MRDNWGQVLRMPAALDLLGSPSPLPVGVVEDLIQRLPLKFAKPSELACIAPGTRIRVKRGAFKDHEATVEWSSRRRVKIVMIVFGGPVDTTLDVSDVEIL